MSHTRLIVLLAVLSAFAAPVLAQPSAAGEWKVNFVVPTGTKFVNMVINQQKTTLSGTVISEDGEFPLTGRIVDDQVTVVWSVPEDGKMMEMEFKGMAVEGYDNVKKKFVSTWIDNMGTGIMHLEGTYDADAKTFTYTGEYEPMPGMKTRMREVIKVTDKNHRTFEFFEDRGGKEVRTMEINYTRKS